MSKSATKTVPSVGSTESSSDDQEVEAEEVESDEGEGQSDSGEGSSEDESSKGESVEGEESEDEGEGEGEREEAPEWASKKIAQVSSEAKKYRKKLREAEEALSKATTPEETAQVIEDLKDSNAKLERQVVVSEVAAKFRLPKELAELVKGEDRESMETHAKTLQRFAGSVKRDPKDLDGGLKPGSNDDGFDAVQTARAARRRR